MGCLDPSNCQLHMLWVCYEPKHIINNRCFKCIFKSFLAQQLQQHLHHLLLLLLDLVFWDIVVNEGTQIHQPNCYYLFNSFMHQLLHHKVKELNTGHPPIHDQEPGIPPELSTGQWVLHHVQVVLKEIQCSLVKPNLAVSVVVRVHKDTAGGPGIWYWNSSKLILNNDIFDDVLLRLL